MSSDSDEQEEFQSVAKKLSSGSKRSGNKHIVCSSPTKQSKGRVSSFMDQNGNAGDHDILSGDAPSGFQLEVEKVAEK